MNTCILGALFCRVGDAEDMEGWGEDPGVQKKCGGGEREEGCNVLCKTVWGSLLWNLQKDVQG